LVEKFNLLKSNIIDNYIFKWFLKISLFISDPMIIINIIFYSKNNNY